MQDLEFQLNPSFFLAALLSMLYCLATGVVFYLELPWIFKFLLLAVLLISAYFHFQNEILKNSKDAIVGIIHDENPARFGYYTREGMRRWGQLIHYYHSQFFIIIALKVKLRKIHIVIAFDAMTPIEFRALTRRLRNSA